MSNLSLFFMVLIYIVTSLICCNGSNVELTIQSTTDYYFVPKCRFGNHSALYPANEVWKYLTGYECFHYRNTDRLNYILEPQLTTVENYTVPYVVFNGTSIFFDFEDQSYLDLIRPLFKTDWFYALWKQCSKSAVDCCENYLNEINVHPTEDYVCSAFWDGLDCWLPEISGETSKKTCPTYINDIVCSLESEKYCLSDDWSSSTNYNQCAASTILKRRHQFRITTLIVPLAFTFPALIIYLILLVKRGRYQTASRNFVVATILKDVVTFISTKVIILDYLEPEDVSNGVMNNNGIGCIVLTFLNNYFTAVVFTSMLITCLYVATNINITIPENSTNTNIIIFLWSLFGTGPWVLVSGIIGLGNCWLMDPYGLHVIHEIYIYVTLIGNLIIFFDLVIGLTWRNKFNTAKSIQQAKTFSCTTGILTLLFGVPYLLTSQSYLIDQNNCLYRENYYYLIYIIEASQGVVVTSLFCYLDNTVCASLRRCMLGTDKLQQSSSLDESFTKY